MKYPNFKIGDVFLKMYSDEEIFEEYEIIKISPSKRFIKVFEYTNNSPSGIETYETWKRAESFLHDIETYNMEKIE